MAMSIYGATLPMGFYQRSATLPMPSSALKATLKILEKLILKTMHIDAVIVDLQMKSFQRNLGPNLVYSGLVQLGNGLV